MGGGAPRKRKPNSKLRLSPDFARQLHLTEERFLEILLSQFSVLRRLPPAAAGFELRVRFDEHTPAIWNHQGRRRLRELQSAALRATYQRELDAFLLGDGNGGGASKTYEFNDPGFLFRYASGGTLPIMRFTEGADRSEYYCLFYREVAPIGWNLANGGTDNRAELLNPQVTIERELREELIIADVTRDRRYIFPSDIGKQIDHPAHAIARRLWNQQVPHKNLAHLRGVPVALSWVTGPDSLRVQMGDETPITRRGFFLNINGDDFGIELDRIARLAVPEDVVLFDGEIDGGRLMNCPVGLFNVNRFAANSAPETLQRKAFIPDFFFFNGVRYEGDQIRRILKHEFLGLLHEHLRPADMRDFKACLAHGKPFALCPVTARIILRYSRWVEAKRVQGQESGEPEVASSNPRGPRAARGQGETLAHAAPGTSSSTKDDAVAQVEAAKDGVAKIIGGGKVIRLANGREIDLSKRHKARSVLLFIHDQVEKSKSPDFYFEEMQDLYNKPFPKVTDRRRWKSSRFREDLFNEHEAEFDALVQTLDKSRGLYRLNF